jgi:hypothetical protein
VAKETDASTASPGVRTSPHVSRKAASGPLSPTEPSQRRVPQRRGGGQVVQRKRVTQKDAAQTSKNIIVNALFSGVENSLSHSLPTHARTHACAHANGPLMAPVVCAGRECCRIHL